jgi:hypothetical protein
VVVVVVGAVIVVERWIVTERKRVGLGRESENKGANTSITWVTEIIHFKIQLI